MENERSQFWLPQELWDKIFGYMKPIQWDLSVNDDEWFSRGNYTPLCQVSKALKTVAEPYLYAHLKFVILFPDLPAEADDKRHPKRHRGSRTLKKRKKKAPPDTRQYLLSTTSMLLCRSLAERPQLGRFVQRVDISIARQLTQGMWSFDRPMDNATDPAFTAADCNPETLYMQMPAMVHVRKLYIRSDCPMFGCRSLEDDFITDLYRFRVNPPPPDTNSATEPVLDWDHPIVRSLVNFTELKTLHIDANNGLPRWTSQLVDLIILQSKLQHLKFRVDVADTKAVPRCLLIPSCIGNPYHRNVGKKMRSVELEIHPLIEDQNPLTKTLVESFDQIDQLKITRTTGYLGTTKSTPQLLGVKLNTIERLHAYYVTPHIETLNFGQMKSLRHLTLNFDQSANVTAQQLYDQVFAGPALRTIEWNTHRTTWQHSYSHDELFSPSTINTLLEALQLEWACKNQLEKFEFSLYLSTYHLEENRGDQWPRLMKTNTLVKALLEFLEKSKIEHSIKVTVSNYSSIYFDDKEVSGQVDLSELVTLYMDRTKDSLKEPYPPVAQTWQQSYNNPVRSISLLGNPPLFGTTSYGNASNTNYYPGGGVANIFGGPSLLRGAGAAGAAGSSNTRYSSLRGEK